MILLPERADARLQLAVPQYSAKPPPTLFLGSTLAWVLSYRDRLPDDHPHRYPCMRLEP